MSNENFKLKIIKSWFDNLIKFIKKYKRILKNFYRSNKDYTKKDYNYR